MSAKANTYHVGQLSIEGLDFHKFMFGFRRSSDCTFSVILEESSELLFSKPLIGKPLLDAFI